MDKYMRSGNRFRSTASAGSKWITILILVLVFAAGFFVSKVTIGNSLGADKVKAHLHSQLRSEAKNAVNYVNKLSRNNGTSSDYYTVSTIKESIHSMEVLNELSIAFYGEAGRIYTADELSTAEARADSFTEKLSSGGKVTEALTALSEAAQVLYEKTFSKLGE